METRRATIYFVNGDRQESTQDELTVRRILENAEFKPAEQYQLIRDHPHQVFTDPNQTVEIHERERFTAVFQGPTPTS